MEDKKIIELYFSRDENAISQTLLKYKSYCEAIADNITGNKQDTEECINSSMLDIWNSIPPDKPKNFRVYIGRIVKNNAIDIYRHMTAQKRGGNVIDDILDEVSELSDNFSVEQNLEQRDVIRVINDYLKTLTDKKRKVFVLRYWHCCDVSEIAGVTGYTEANVYNILKRERKRLISFLKKRGVSEWRI